MPSSLTARIKLRDVEVAAVVFAALAGVVSIVRADAPDVRFSIVLLAPTLEAALPLFARWVWPAKAHGARLVALLLVAFYIALAPLGIDSYLYLPALGALAVALFMSNRERWRRLRAREQRRRD